VVPEKAGNPDFNSYCFLIPGKTGKPLYFFTADVKFRKKRSWLFLLPNRSGTQRRAVSPGEFPGANRGK